MIIEKKHNWKTQSGLDVEAVSELLITETTLNADGWETSTTRRSVFTNFTIRVGGKRIDSYLAETPRTVKGVEYAASYGPLVISAENLAAIKEIIERNESHPAMVAKRAAFDASLAADIDYDKRTAKIKKAMAL